METLSETDFLNTEILSRFSILFLLVVWVWMFMALPFGLKQKEI